MNLSGLKVYCGHQDYLSHARAARDYRAILASLCTLVEDPAACDVALLHHEPSEYARILEEIPALRPKYIIGYCVWEADTLPPSLRHGVRFMDELWTASVYCYEAFAQAHPRVVWVPHVVSYNATHTPQDAQAVAKMLQQPADTFNFLHITTTGIRRKNTAALREAFTYVAKRVPQARLLIKTIEYPSFSLAPMQVEHSGSTTLLQGKLPEGQLAALYAASHALVSPHCSEGWGLTLSDAMLQGIPVIATAYSGNMDFMTPYNSWWLSFTEEPIRAADRYYLFNGSMRWAYPHRESLERQMLEVFHMTQNKTAARITARAQADIALYDAEHVAHLVGGRLSQIATRLADGSLRPCSAAARARARAHSQATPAPAAPWPSGGGRHARH